MSGILGILSFLGTAWGWLSKLWAKPTDEDRLKVNANAEVAGQAAVDAGQAQAKVQSDADATVQETIAHEDQSHPGDPGAAATDGMRELNAQIDQANRANDQL